MKLRKMGVLLAALAMAATGCRGGDTEEGDGAISAPGVSDALVDALARAGDG